MNLNCYIVDDQWSCIRLLENYIERTGELTLAGTANNAEAAYADLVSGRLRADVAFVDIAMPGTDGLELAHLIMDRTKLVFTTGFRDYGPEAFALRALDYLLKPVTYERFLKSIDVVREALLSDSKALIKTATDFTFIPGDGRKNWARIQNDEVLFLKSESNYVRFVFPEGSRLSYMSMEKALAMLPGELFVRVHKSYAVNLSKVKHIEATSLTMVNGKIIPIGRSFKEKLNRRITG